MQRSLLKSLRYSLLGVERTRRRLESLCDQGHLVGRDLEMAYSGLFIRSVTSFEAFLEDLFLAVLAGKTARSTYTAKTLFPELRSFSTPRIRLLLLGDRRFFDWLPYSYTETRANRYFAGKTPFAAIDSTDKKALDEILYIRNALAHASPHARDTFATKVIRDLPLPPRERTPVGYLRSSYRSVPSQTRFEHHSSELLRIAAILAC